jgi:uridine kinase
MEKLLAAVTTALPCRTPEHLPILIGIDGPGGSGKSTFAVALARRLQQERISAAIVHMDDFFLPSTQRPAGDGADKPPGSDFDWQRLRHQVLIPLAHHQPTSYQRYDWLTDKLSEWHTLAGCQVVIVEGIYTLLHELRVLIDLTIWIDCPRAIRLARGIARDGEAARTRWERDWMPAEDRYIVTHRPQLTVDFLVTNADPTARVPDWHIQRNAVKGSPTGCAP